MRIKLMLQFDVAVGIAGWFFFFFHLCCEAELLPQVKRHRLGKHGKCCCVAFPWPIRGGGLQGFLECALPDLLGGQGMLHHNWAGEGPSSHWITFKIGTLCFFFYIAVEFPWFFFKLMAQQTCHLCFWLWDQLKCENVNLGQGMFHTSWWHLNIKNKQTRKHLTSNNWLL